LLDIQAINSDIIQEIGIASLMGLNLSRYENKKEELRSSLEHEQRDWDGICCAIFL
jgi:hypothetical protein